MHEMWWVIGVGLLLWGLFTEGLSAVVWSIVGTIVAAVIAVALFAALVNPTGAVIVASLILAAGTWRLMWWLTDRGHI